MKVYGIAFLLALAIHLAVLFGGFGPSSEILLPEVAVQNGAAGVEVELVAALPSESTETTEESTEPLPEEAPVETPPPPEKEEVKEPPLTPEVIETPTAPAEFTVPSATPAAPEVATEPLPTQSPMPAATPRRSVETPRINRATRPPRSGDGSSSIVGRDATSAAASTGIDSKPKPFPRNPRPPYPREARQLKQEGVVKLRLKIDSRGNVASAELVGSSGYPLLDESALRTVSRAWRFQPATLRGVPVATEVTIPIRFSLQEP